MGKINLQEAINRLADMIKYQVRTVGTYSDINFNQKNTVNIVTDMSGRADFENNEKGIVLVDSTGVVITKKTWDGVKKYVDSQILLIDSYKKAEADAKFEPKSYDFSNSESPLTYNLTNSKRFQIISKPAGADNTPIGATNKLVVKVATTDATELPQDADQVTYGVDSIWIVKQNGDIMSWGEIKDNVAAKKIMVIKHLSNGNWELVRWEVAFLEKIEKNTSDINTLKSNGVAIPHLEVTTPLSDAEIDTKLKALVSTPQDAEVAYVGTNKDWTLWEYNLANTVWVKTSTGSQHTTTIEAYTKQETDTKFNEKSNKDLSNVNVGVANAGKILQVKADGTIEYVEKLSGGGFPKIADIPLDIVDNIPPIDSTYDVMAKYAGNGKKYDVSTIPLVGINSISSLFRWVGYKAFVSLENNFKRIMTLTDFIVKTEVIESEQIIIGDIKGLIFIKELEI